MVGKDDSFKTDLKRARGYGSAHHGSGVWLAERMTSVALIPLGLWSVYAVLHLAAAGYDGAIDFLQSPVNIALILLTLMISFHHMHMGMRVILEDYIEHKPSRMLWIGLSAAASLLGAAIALISVLKVAFAGSPD